MENVVEKYEYIIWKLPISKVQTKVKYRNSCGFISNTDK